jgi:excisionase family DNA binding protein
MRRCRVCSVIYEVAKILTYDCASVHSWLDHLKRIVPNPESLYYRYTLTGGEGQVERKTISIMKACELVGVSRRTIYNWLSSGKIEYVRTAGGSVRIFVDTLWRDPHNTDRPAVQAVWQAEGRNQA